MSGWKGTLTGGGLAPFSRHCYGSRLDCLPGPARTRPMKFGAESAVDCRCARPATDTVRFLATRERRCPHRVPRRVWNVKDGDGNYRHSCRHRLLKGPGRDEFVLHADADRGLGSTFRDRERDSGITLTTTKGIAGLGFLSPGGKIVLDMGAQSDGRARLIIRDTDGKELLQLPKP